MRSFAGCAFLITSAAAADAHGINLMDLMKVGQDMLDGLTFSQSFTGEDGETKTLNKAFHFPAMKGNKGSGLKIKKFTFPQDMEGSSPMSMSFSHSFKSGDGGAQSVSFSPMKMTGLKIKKADTKIQDPVTIYKTLGNFCRQVTVDKSQEKMAITMMMGGQVGTCADAGYKIATGKREKHPVTVLTFKKTAGGPDEPDMKAVMKQMQPQINEVMKMFVPQMQQLAKGMQGAAAPKESVTLYKVQGSECGQATLDKKFEQPAISFAHLKEGTCASQGFTTPDGTKTLQVPVIGSITVAKFKKANKLLLKKDGIVV